MFFWIRNLWEFYFDYNYFKPCRKRLSTRIHLNKLLLTLSTTWTEGAGTTTTTAGMTSGCCRPRSMTQNAPSKNQKIQVTPKQIQYLDYTFNEWFHFLCCIIIKAKTQYMYVSDIISFQNRWQTGVCGDNLGEAPQFGSHSTQVGHLWSCGTSWSFRRHWYDNNDVYDVTAAEFLYNYGLDPYDREV